jgi:hypothetical protein
MNIKVDKVTYVYRYIDILIILKVGMYIKIKINIDKRNEETILHNGLMSW